MRPRIAIGGLAAFIALGSMTACGADEGSSGTGDENRSDEIAAVVAALRITP